MRLALTLTATLSVPDGSRVEDGKLILPDGSVVEPLVFLAGAPHHVSFVQDPVGNSAYRELTSLVGERIGAELNANDGRATAFFDARLSFMTATDDELRGLANRGWQGQELDWVAEALAETDQDVRSVFEYTGHAEIGSEVLINGQDALAWIKANRSEALYLEVSGEDDPDDGDIDPDDLTPPPEFARNAILAVQTGTLTDFEFTFDARLFFCACTPDVILQMAEDAFGVRGSLQPLHDYADRLYDQLNPRYELVTGEQAEEADFPEETPDTFTLSVDTRSLTWWLKPRATNGPTWALAYQATRRHALQSWPQDEVDHGGDRD